jgi:hypothetical protein
LFTLIIVVEIVLLFIAFFQLSEKIFDRHLTPRIERNPAEYGPMVISIAIAILVIVVVLDIMLVRLNVKVAAAAFWEDTASSGYVYSTGGKHSYAVLIIPFLFIIILGIPFVVMRLVTAYCAFYSAFALKTKNTALTISIILAILMGYVYYVYFADLAMFLRAILPYMVIKVITILVYIIGSFYFSLNGYRNGIKGSFSF